LRTVDAVSPLQIQASLLEARVLAAELDDMPAGRHFESVSRFDGLGFQLESLLEPGAGDYKRKRPKRLLSQK
jgi:hypothetical protein